MTGGAAVLEGRTAVVAGGTGHVGEGIVRALLRAGATVVTTSRSEARLDTLRGLLGTAATDRLVGVAVDVSRRDGAEQVARLVEERFGGADLVVAALGGWWQGKALTEVDDETWARLLHDLLTSHFVLARAMLPGMVARGSGEYVLINGFSAEEAYPGAGPVSVAAAGQLHLARNLIAEHRGTGVRVFDLVLGPIMSRARTRGRAEWLSADDVGDFTAWLGAGHGEREGAVYRLPDRPAADAIRTTGG